MCAAIIAYLGPFGPKLRQEQTTKWVQQINNSGLACSSKAEDFQLCLIFGDPVQLMEWNNIGLPLNDYFVMGSALITRLIKRLNTSLKYFNKMRLLMQTHKQMAIDYRSRRTGY